MEKHCIRHKKRKFVTALFLVIFALNMINSNAVFSYADNSTKTVKVGFYEAGNMMSGACDEAKKAGYAYEYLQEISYYLGFRCEYVYEDFPTLLKMLSSGEIDILPYLNYSKEREASMLFPKRSMGEEQFFLAILPKNADKIEVTQKSMNGLKIGIEEEVYQNNLLEQYLSDNQIKATLVPFRTVEEKHKALLDGTIDISFDSSVTASDETVLLREIGSLPYYLGIAKNNEVLLEEIDKAQDDFAKMKPSFLSTLEMKFFANTPIRRNLSKEETQWIKNHPVIVAGGLTNDNPYEYELENGTITGVTPALLKSIFENLGVDIEVKWKLYPSMQELHEAIHKGEIDLINPEYHSYSDADEAGLLISDTMMPVNMGVLYKETVNEETMKVIATPGTRLGIYYVRDNYPEATVVPCSTVLQCIEKVVLGQANGAIAHTSVLEEFVTEFSQSEGLAIAPLNAPVNICFSARKEDAELIRIINRGIPIISEDELNYLLIEYTKDKEVKISANDFFRAHPEYVDIGLIMFVLIIAATIAFIMAKANARKLKEANAEIKKVNDGLELMVSTRTKALEDSWEEARTANEAKSKFLFNMSHDIRTPLNAIKGFSEMAEKHIDDKEKVLDCLSKVNTAGAQLLNLVNDVLDMSKIESGKVSMGYEKMNISTLIDNCTSIIGGQLLSRQLEFVIDFPEPKYPRVFGDELRMRQILINILGNAVKFTPDGGKISFSIKEVSHENNESVTYEFTVKDTGRGMKKEFIDHIFDAFSQEQDSARSQYEGTGLGMAITKQFVDLLGGTIKVESEVKKGSTFVVTIPFVIDNEPVVEREKKVITEGSISGLKLLLAEDNLLNREMAEEMLEDEGAIVTTAPDGKCAVDMFKDSPEFFFDAILMDIMMPTMNGYEAAKAIREMDRQDSKSVLIIALSANAFSEDKMKSLEAGMDDHVSKPLDIETLKKALMLSKE